MSRRPWQVPKPISKSEHPGNPLIVLTSAATGRKLAVSGIWIRSIEETNGGTVIALGDGVTATVEEDFLSVLSEFAPESHGERVRGKRRP